MSSPFEESDFIDRDLSASPGPGRAVPPPSALPTKPAQRPPSREEIEARVGENQARLADLKRAQEELERERAALEEARRRRAEFEVGRNEMLNNLTRGIGLLEKAEFDNRRQAEQMATSLTAFREAHAAVQAIREEAWTQETWNSELTRALTTIENARMEWNGARLKFPLLDGAVASPQTAADPSHPHPTDWFAGRSLGSLCRLGLALTWPVAVAFLLGALLLLIFLRR
jgi:hypothetical protein